MANITDVVTEYIAKPMQRWTVDVGTKVPVHKVRIELYTVGVVSYNYDLLASDDNTTFTRLISNSTNPELFEVDFGQPYPEHRQWRVEETSGSEDTNIGNFEIYIAD